MRLHALLKEARVAPQSVTLLFHTPREASLRRVIASIAVEQPELFAAYQGTHVKAVQATVARRPYLASFVSGEGSDAVFAGLFRVGSYEHWSAERLDSDPRFIQLNKLYGTIRFSEEQPEGRLFFDLEPVPAMADLVGRLVVGRPSGRAYARLGEKCDPEVVEIARESRLVARPPSSRDFIVTGAEVRSLPQGWRTRLAEWRGIYLIVDQSDGQRYVGSAYGAENLLARWEAHVRGDRGITVELARRDPANFRFSILQLVAPEDDIEAVVALEASWKKRLDTMAHGLNRN